MSQALALVSDLKLGLYCKIPPKTMFFVQSVGTALGAIVNYSQYEGIVCRSGETDHSCSIRAICHQCEAAVPGRHSGGSDRTVDGQLLFIPIDQR